MYVKYFLVHIRKSGKWPHPTHKLIFQFRMKSMMMTRIFNFIFPQHPSPNHLFFLTIAYPPSCIYCFHITCSDVSFIPWRMCCHLEVVVISYCITGLSNWFLLLWLTTPHKLLLQKMFPFFPWCVVNIKFQWCMLVYMGR